MFSLPFKIWLGWKASLWNIIKLNFHLPDGLIPPQFFFRLLIITKFAEVKLFIIVQMKLNLTTNSHPLLSLILAMTHYTIRPTPPSTFTATVPPKLRITHRLILIITQLYFIMFIIYICCDWIIWWIIFQRFVFIGKYGKKSQLVWKFESTLLEERRI